MFRTTRSPLLRQAALVAVGALALAFIPVVSFAQEEEPAESEVGEESGEAVASDSDVKSDEKVEEIVVTGSMIRRKDLSSSAPVAIIQKLELDASGLVSIGDILQDLPAQSNAINIQVNNGGSGSTRVNLRGVGASRTLVLLNGKRFPYGGLGANASVDLNSIPTAVIERVEVLKDGASSIYGSDAIGGVVNIITRKEFQGVDTSAYVGGTSHGDGLVYDLSVTAGHNSENGNILFSAGVYEQKEIWAGDRGYSKYDYQVGGSGWDRSKADQCPGRVVDGGLCEVQGGSWGTPEGTIIDFEIDSSPEWDALKDKYGDDVNDYWINDPTEGWRPANPNGTSDIGTGDKYNYQPANYLVTPQKRYSLFLSGNYRFSDYVKTYMEASYVNRRSDQLLAAEPLYNYYEDIVVSGDNYYNPFKRDFLFMGRRMLETGGRNFIQDLDTMRFSIGLEGALPENLGPFSSWNWDLNYTYGRTAGTSINKGNFYRPRVADALGPSFKDEDDNIVCGTPGNVIAGCVPLNIFGGQKDPITQEMLDYIGYEGVQRGYNEIESVNFTIGGDVYEIPFGGMIGLAVGYSYREESGGVLPNPLEAKGDTTGNKSEPVSGQYFVNELFAELNVPLLAAMPGAEELELNASIRYSDYSNFGSEVTWKTGARWQIIQDLAVRGTYSTAFRAPAIVDLYSGSLDSFPLTPDPCSKATGVAAENCQADGIPASFTDNQDQHRSRVGGNTELKPETANIITAGLVFEPSFLEGLSLAIDYWNLDIDKTMVSIGADIILNECYNNPTADRQYCDKIDRDPTSHLISYINDKVTNAGGLETWGFDGQIRYKMKNTLAGSFQFSLEGTYTADYTLILANRKKVQGQGWYDQELALPSWRFRFATIWGMDEYGAGINMRFVGLFQECEGNDCGGSRQSAGEDGISGNADDYLRYTYIRDVDPNLTVDLWLAYTLESPIGTTKLTVGVNNLFDADPETIYNGFTATSDPSAYDFLGRFFYGRLSQSF